MTILVHCDCGHYFEAPESMVGGLANCPSCGKATTVDGLRDPLWRLWQGIAVVLLVVAVGLVYATLGLGAAVVAVGIGLLLAWLASRLL